MKFIRPIILFLDDDPAKSAEYLVNFLLEQNIRNACQVLMCSIYYMMGFRTKTVFRHYFSKERWDDTRFKYFPQYPLKTSPKFTFYTSAEARWCRKCTNHYRLVSDHMGAALGEYRFRFGRGHDLEDMYGFLRTLPFELSVRYGIKLATLKDKTKVQLPWKSLPLKFRKKDVLSGYRAYYKSLIESPIAAFIGTKRDVPEFLLDKEPLV